MEQNKPAIDVQILKFRGEVIELFANIENMIGIIISFHYFKMLNKLFLLEVLYDDNCSFSLKRNILFKIVPDFDDDVRNCLYRMNSIRNIFAHCGLKLMGGPTPDSMIEFFPDPRNPQKNLDFKALRDEFITLLPKVNNYLLKLLEGHGPDVVVRKFP